MEHDPTIGALCGGRLAKAKGVRYGPPSLVCPVWVSYVLQIVLPLFVLHVRETPILRFVIQGPSVNVRETPILQSEIQGPSVNVQETPILQIVIQGPSVNVRETPILRFVIHGPSCFFVIQRTFRITENENRKQSTDSCQDLFSVKSGSLKSVCKILDPDLTENRP